jgi:hypothetical protein
LRDAVLDGRVEEPDQWSDGAEGIDERWVECCARRELWLELPEREKLLELQVVSGGMFLSVPTRYSRESCPLERSYRFFEGWCRHDSVEARVG